MRRLIIITLLLGVSIAGAATTQKLYELPVIETVRDASKLYIFDSMSGSRNITAAKFTGGAIFSHTTSSGAHTKYLLKSGGQVGNSTDYMAISSAGHVTFSGAATTWDDIRVEPTVRSTTGLGIPSRDQWFDNTGLNVTTAGVGGVHLYSFTDESVAGNEKEVRFNLQLPHTWCGTAIYPHVHWVGSVADTTANPRWGLEYTFAEIGADFGATTPIYGTAEKVGAGGSTDANVTAGRHYISVLPAITPSASQDGISSILIGRLFRNSSSASDTYDASQNKAGLLYIDFHIEQCRLGSNSEYTP